MMNGTMERGGVAVLEYMPGVELRTVAGDDGEVLVCLSDLAKGLGVQNVSQLASRLPSNVCQTYVVDPSRGGRPMLFVTEAGMNMVIWRSDKPEALAYAKWCAERIVELRKYGATSSGPQAGDDLRAIVADLAGAVAQLTGAVATITMAVQQPTREATPTSRRAKPVGGARWTEAEDYVVVTHSPRVASRMLPNRSMAAIRQRKYVTLKHVS